MTALPILIDCDPGQDDFINLLLAFASPEDVRVEAITTVGGNVPLPHTHRNARLACDLVGRDDIAVSAGCPQPLLRPLETAEYLHGESGIDGYDFDAPRLALSTEHGVDTIVRIVRARCDERLTLVATGPLTNVAMALKKAPDIGARIAEIVIMGGAMREGGNVTPSAEFNIAVDPHAADIVFRSGIPIALFGLDVTHQFVMGRARRERLRAIETPAAVAVADMLDFSVRYDESKYGTDGAPLHDPCTLLYLLAPDLFDLKRCAVGVETESVLTYGHTAVDFWGVTDRASNALWAYAIDHEAAFELLCERITRL
ncbi:nucleoside hydrolase [Salinisphaera sp.]|uniref:nucleoside hydrolase n=1 Tax=Salinisphaera sp. TaxID=1914330 RepID=UPI002D785DC3|nr:nucleoside hydrolase [Salinisphaera sp.]HET7314908.1 nucleoside hydrolase [Salinisphaera sp.]